MSDLNFNMLKWQREVMRAEARFKVIVAGRRCGKTRMSIVSILVKALECPDKTGGVLYVAPTQGMARVLCWNLLVDLGHPVIVKSNVNNSEVTLVNGVTIYVRGADSPDSLRGMKLYYAVLDEFKDMKPQAWEMIIRPSLSDMKGGALFIGTPEPGDSLFRDYYERGQTNDDPEWKSWLFTTYDNELIDPREIEAAKRSMSTIAFSQEYLASFDTMGENIFKEVWLKYSPDPPQQGDTFIAVDPAGFEEVKDPTKRKQLDNTAIAVVTVTDDGKWWVRKIDYGRWDVRETAVRILMAIRAHKPMSVGIEKGALQRALMPYLQDLMRKNNVYTHIDAIPIGSGSKVNRITYNLQGLFEHGRITLNSREDWTQFKKEYVSFPSTKSHDDCFPAYTPVVTVDGVKPISEVTTADYVLTRNGFRRVLKAWCKGTKEVITRFGITATPDHRIFTENRGWVTLDSLCLDDILLECKPIKETSCERQSSLTDASTTDTLTQNKATTSGTTPPIASGKPHQDCSIETSGSSITAQSQMGITSITKMETSITTPLKILSASLPPRIKWSISKSEVSGPVRQSIWRTLPLYETALKCGTNPPKDESGTDNTPCAQSLKNTQSSLALYVEPCTSQRSADPVCVATNANVSEKTLSNVKQPVYDLMVEHDHEFFAWGVLVHNCIDSLSLVANMVITSYGAREISDEYEALDEIAGI